MTRRYTSSGYTETVSTRWGSEEKTINYHWGVLLYQDKPTTGVYGGNELDWDGMPYDWIDLDYESCVNDIMNDEGIDEEDKDEAIENLSNYFESGDTLLYGSWIKDENGQYIPDKSSTDDGDFAAILNVNVNTLQVVWSRTIRYGQLASPCYPGQVSTSEDDTTAPDDTHVQAYYALPEGCIYTEAQHQQDCVFMKFLERERELAKIDAENAKRP